VNGVSFILSSVGVRRLAGEVVVLGSALGPVMVPAGAQEADRTIGSAIPANAISEGQRYKDTLKDLHVKLSEGQEPPILYVGEFVHKQPDGHGRAFWPSSKTDALNGQFVNGKFSAGFIIDELSVVIGYFRVENGALVADGWQPETMFNDECGICMENAPLSSMNKGFAPCMHGNICLNCTEEVLARTRQCPFCRGEVTGIVRRA